MPTVPPHKRVLSEEEFGRLFGSCRTPFVTIANSYVHDRPVAEDLVDDGFARLWEKRDEIITDNFEAYLFRIVIRNCLDHLKSAQTQSRIRKEIHDTHSRMLLHEIQSLESCDPNRLFADEIETIFRNCIERMPHAMREIFLASRFRNKTYQEIAAERGITVRQVTSEIQAALAFLRQHLKDYLPMLVMLLWLWKNSPE